MRGPMKGPAGLWIRLFRVVLGVYPRRWRARFAEEALDAFRRGLERRLEEPGAESPHRYAVRALADAVASGWRERTNGPAGAGRATGGGDGGLATLAADLRYAVRRLGRAPGFTVAVVTILALGVGANAAVFTVLRNAVLAPLPFPEADRLVLPRRGPTLAGGGPDTAFVNWSYPKFVELREGSTEVFEEVAAYAARSAGVSDPGRAESVPFEFITPGYFEVLGINPVVGRFFHPEEEGRDAPPGVVVLSHGLWVQRFGSDPDVVGRTITADGDRLEVVGVAPEGFGGLTGSARFWTPVGQTATNYGSWTLEGRTSHWHHVVGRLRPGLSPGQAEERLAALFESIEAVEPTAGPGEEIALDVTPLSRIWTNPDARASAWLAMAAALLVLAIAVANLAALLLARGRRETRETAVRLALGAGRGRLIRERLTESLLLSAVGGGVGLLLAGWTMGGLRAAIPRHLFRGAGGDLLLVETGALEVDPGVAAFGLLVAVLAGALFGTAPAVVQNRIDLVPALRQGGGRSRTTRRGDGRRWLVGAQVALSVTLLVGAGLLLGTLHRLHGEQQGFDPENLLVLRYSLGSASSEYAGDAAREFHRTFRDRLRALPEVRSATLATTPPLGGHYIQSRVRRVEGREPIPEGSRPRIGIHLSDGDLFRTLGTELLRGRTFTEGEFQRQEFVTVVSRRAADELFPDEDPLGREIRVGFSVTEEERPFRIVGVVEDVLYSPPTSGIMPEMYLPLGLWAPGSIGVFLRTRTDPTELVAPARRILASMDEDVPFWQVKTGMELRGEDVADTRILLILLGTFAALALILSAAGLWAVVAQSVTERRREIGLRMALGARAREVEVLVFRQGLVPIVAGGCLGIVLAATGAPRMAALLFGIGPRSPAVYLGAAGILVVVALLATWLPARQAARVHPMEALAAD